MLFSFICTQESYLNLSDATFKVRRGNSKQFSDLQDRTLDYHSYLYLSFVLHVKKLIMSSSQDLRRKLPVTRTLFPWHNTHALSLTRDLAKELALGK